MAAATRGWLIQTAGVRAEEQRRVDAEEGELVADGAYVTPDRVASPRAHAHRAVERRTRDLIAALRVEKPHEGRVRHVVSDGRGSAALVPVSKVGVRLRAADAVAREDAVAATMVDASGLNGAAAPAPAPREGGVVGVANLDDQIVRDRVALAVGLEAVGQRATNHVAGHRHAIGAIN